MAQTSAKTYVEMPRLWSKRQIIETTATMTTQTDAPKHVQCYLDGNARITKTNLVSERISVEMEK